MSKSINSMLNESAMKILRPLVRVMLRNGISCGSFEELVRKAYVDEAFSIGRKNQQKTTISSVSAQTGLSRKEVKRLTEVQDSHHSDIEQRYNRAIRVISGWVNDKKYTNASGKPEILPIDGDTGSFSSLIREYSGDITVKAMLNLLLAADCVALKDNKVELVKHAYVPGKDSAEIIRILGSDTSELINTIDYNLTAADSVKRYQRKVSNSALNKEAVDEFKAIASERSQALLEELDEWLSRNEVDPNDENARYISLGIYYYEHEDSGE